MKRNVALLLALPSLVLTGCSGAEADPEPTAPNVEAPTSDAAQPQDEELSSRGNRVVDPGDAVVLTGYEDDTVEGVTFAVKSIEVDPTCTSPYAMAPENGHFVAVEIEVETSPEPAFSEVTYGHFSLTHGEFKVVDKNGTTLNEISSGPSYGCFDQAETLPNNIGAGERVTGKMVLDIPNPEGVLIYEHLMNPDSPGWEWSFPTQTVGA